MFSSADYQLLDFGDGRKLERFGPYLIDRPAPAAAAVRRSQPELWPQATARFELHGDPQGADRGRWVPADALPERWTVEFGPLRFELKPTDFGHLGVFPEQEANWQWIAEQVRSGTVPFCGGHHRRGLSPFVAGTVAATVAEQKGTVPLVRSAASGTVPLFAQSAQQKRGLSPLPGTRLKVLNLFAHTGGSTLAAAQAGAEVVHVDSSKSAVAWARRNAELSGLSAAPIRWIVEDAPRFVRRELTRGNHYDAVILDPPSYGHGPSGETWKLESDLPALLEACAALTAPRCHFLLLTCHTPSLTPPQAQSLLATAFAGSVGNGVPSGPSAVPDPGTVPTPPPTPPTPSPPADLIEAHPLELPRPDGAALPCGLAARLFNRMPQ